MKTTWILNAAKDNSHDLLVYFEGILTSLKNGAQVTELWSKPGELGLELVEPESEELPHDHLPASQIS
ncbi:hypothetical protein [Paenibacillus sonchi]|uniref:hypothetical protein n=1 Tax=Paenibacillus sonchi TaxID=373687 RepID=UPI001E379A74|nr:hypothetical protein [Paenibacillus sonchi]MCE3202498.1 hypothetical protein [Paenibacillus sonchi]